MQGIVRFVITTRDFGQIKAMRPIPSGTDIWGSLAPLRGTAWEPLIPVVSGEALSHALHGYAKPLMEQIGPPPEGLARMLPSLYRECSFRKDECISAGPHCYVGDPKLPECYSAPHMGTDTGRPASVVAVAWAEGRYVLVVRGDEFSL